MAIGHDHGNGDDKRHEQRADVDLPVPGHRNTQPVAQQERQRHEGCRHDCVQQEHIEIDPQQVAAEGRDEVPAHLGRRFRNYRKELQQQGRKYGERRADPEHGRYAEARRQERAYYHRNHE